MATKLKVDTSGLKKFEEQLKQLQEGDMQRFNEKMVKELAARTLKKVIERTTVGDYPTNSGKKGGTLRRGWTAKNEEEAENGKGNGKDAVEYINTIDVRRKENLYEIEITNPVNYASYVEYGHRTRGGNGWVGGKFMMTISIQEMESQGPAIIEKRLKVFMEGVLNGK